VIVIDASVLIAHLDDDDSHHATASMRLLELAAEPFGASSITLAEVLVGPIRAGRLDVAHSALQTLGVGELPLPHNASERLASLRVETRLKLPDCCVLLAAEAVAGTVLTFDERLAREAARLRLDTLSDG
jgi:predicted nucleic acid-binding protein